MVGFRQNGIFSGAGMEAMSVIKDLDSMIGHALTAATG